eukprot:CAMPEP_0176080116 /NCGR_PEP_ID=MMETSP0120_2-20121206/40072_1 /TAXON_ID=160619 /ORGANISM="Kryptoperidinium foliaceum, Strain CCMP 1326" /LENGTH=290 /DNA_ID=CAMNT_0017413877 /DNA_START=80 /DNA_END=952 /DNA_ORIENTATION=-
MTGVMLAAEEVEFPAGKRHGMNAEKHVTHEAVDMPKDLVVECRSLESLSLGGVAAMTPQVQLPKKYKKPKAGEVSTYGSAGVVPVTRTPDGQARILLWQPQSGNKKGVRWYDFGGRKESQTEFTSACACRKFAKQTYGIFGCSLNLPEEADAHLEELYQGLANLPLMLRASQDWADLQLLDDSPRIFYNDVHEYHTYLLLVPYVAAEVLDKISELVDGGKRKFRWLSREDLLEEVLAPRLHTDSFHQWIESLAEDEWVRMTTGYGDGVCKPATGCFSVAVARREVEEEVE